MTDPSNEFDAVSSELRDSVSRLNQLVGTLSADDLQTQSYADEWTVATVLSHLGSGAVIGKLRLAEVLDDDHPAFDIQEIWDEWNAKSSEAQAAESVIADAANLVAFQSLTEAQIDSGCFPLGPLQLTTTDFLRARLAEHAMHTWDIAVALDPKATLSAGASEQILPVVNTFMRFYATSGNELSVRVTTTDPSGEYLLVVGEHPSLTVLDAGALASLDANTPHLTIPAEALLRLIYGRLDDANTPDAVEEVDVTVQQLRRYSPGFGVNSSP